MSSRTATISKPRGGRVRKRRERTDHAALMEALADEARTATLASTVSSVARARYGIKPQDSEDIFNEAVLTYLKVHQRYPPKDNHFGLLVGIFYKKALEHLGGKERTGRVAKRLAARLQADRPAIARGEDPKGAASERVIRDEDARLIRRAIDELNEEGREMLLSLAEGRATRLEMISDMGINRNTFDTRLRALRLKLKQKLLEFGVL